MIEKEYEPVVSVIMVTYLHDSFISQAINGVLMQNCDFLVELIIADDCSPDNTQKVVENFITNHPKGSWIRYTRHKKNMGAIDNFLWAFNQVRGKYVAVCEGDDYWIDENKLNKQVQLLNSNKNAGVVFSNVIVKGVEESSTSLKYPASFSLKYYMKNYNAMPFCSMLFMSKDVFFNEKTSSMIRSFPVLDYPLRFLLAINGDFIFMEECTSVYRKHSSGMSNGFHNERFYLSSIRMNNELNKYFNFDYNYFFGVHPQKTYERLFYLCCQKKSIFKGFSFFYKASIGFDKRPLNLKVRLNILKHGVKLFLNLV